MSKSQKLLLAVFLLAVLASLGGVLFFKKNEAQRIEEKFEQSNDQSIQSDPIEENQISEEAFDESAAVQDSPSNSTATKSVTPENCEQECEGFSAIASEQAYCLSYCGLNQSQYQNSDCENLTGSEKDFCFKEKALKERNPETCARIGESSLRKVCEARLAEELFD